MLEKTLSWSDYYPFGLTKDSRSSQSSSYRFGFQGQERDDKVAGDGVSWNYKYRMHNAKYARFFSVDPLSARYPYNSPYSFSENDVIRAIELEGTEKDLFPFFDQKTFGNATEQEVANYRKTTGLAGAYSLSIMGGALLIEGGFVAAPWIAEQSLGLSWWSANPNNQLLMMQGFGFAGGLLYEGTEDLVPSSGSDELGKTTRGVVKLIFKKLYGISRGNAIEGLATAFRYSNWKWLGNTEISYFGKNFPTFDFVNEKGMFSSLKSWDAKKFNYNQYKGFIDAIREKVDNGFVYYKGKYHDVEDGMLDIVVPNDKLKEFTEKGGEFYEQFNKLREYANKNDININISDNVD